VAVHIVEQRQAVGLFSNGRDPLGERRAADPTAPTPGAMAGAADPLADEPLPPPVASDEPSLVLASLPATDRLTAAAMPAPPRRNVLATDPFAPPSLPEETYDEDASIFIDGPALTGPPAAPVVAPIHDGRGHLSSLLTILARITLRESPRERPDAEPAELAPLPFTRLVRRRAAGLPWGTTVVLIAAAPTPDLLPTMLHLRHAGFSPLAIFVQPPRLATDLDAGTIRTAGFPAYDVYDEGMLTRLQLAPIR
jgi:hypothetical protein